MKSKLPIVIVFILLAVIFSCKQKENTSDVKIIFLHHSTGSVIWNGKKTTFLSKLLGRISYRISKKVEKDAHLPLLFLKYNKKNNENYSIKEIAFPKAKPYGWNNEPYDYYNIWVKNAGQEHFMEEPTLEILTKEYQIIIFKHCFPVCNIQENQDSANINSKLKTIINYKLQYTALREKFHSFPDTKFIIFTGATQTKFNVSKDEANRAREFFKWVIEEWDLPGDNIYLWDLYTLQTEGDLYFRDEYAVSKNDSHPNEDFAGRVVKLLFNRIIDIVENEGVNTLLTGEEK